MRAHNEAGVSAYSGPSNAVAPEGCSPGPPAVRACPGGPTAARLEVAAPAEMGGLPVMAYWVEMQTEVRGLGGNGGGGGGGGG